MPTKKVYLESDILGAYAVVTALGDASGRMSVRLDRTVFHAQGGGQRADIGTIHGMAVVDVQHAAEGEVDHVLDGIADFAIGDTVLLAVDADIRAAHARLHTAGHLIAHAACALVPGLVAKAGHHWPQQGRVELLGELSQPEVFAGTLSDNVAEAIAGDLPVARVGDPYANRAIQIGDFAPVGCGGTHVASLAEICSITIRRLQQKKGVIRISYGVAGEA